ncbi:lipopolysaccharide biosynthesis protein [Phreatobacter aquaticus]|uniref:Lipopolysaccharide biosynthesis protein n=1 Tax=Phreatobacter aquaticus TaxID=2570229 RepID=A0A4D7QJK0_9HYPH|nr:lipopolysaccharide biosynthesis protein [Phreatobacter aquaticus]QCK87830.1 lipopolysaccharide biosynthesis protein [Phreatobacter aquaticus]
MLTMKAVRGAGWLVFSRFLGRFIDFFTLLILARVLMPADFGVVALALTLVVVVDTVLEVPVTQALTRLSAIDKSHLDTGFTLGFLRGLVISAVIVAAAWPFSLIYNDRALILLVIALAAGPIARGLYSPAMVHFVRELSFRQAFISEFIGKLAAFASAIGVVMAGGGYWAIVANFVMAPMAATVASYVLAPYRPSLSLARFNQFSSFVGWFSSAQIVSALNWQFDRVLLGAFVDKTMLGRYTVASDLAVLPTQSLIGPAMQPVMAAFSNISDDPERLKLAFLKAARFAMLISAPICIGLALTGDLVIVLLLGAKWQETGEFLRLLALSVVTIPYFQALYSFALAIDRPVAIFRINLFDLAIRVVFVSLGLYLFSVTGTIIARLLTSVAMFGCYMIFARMLAGVGLRAQIKNIWKIGVASAAMAGCVMLLRAAVAPVMLPVIVELVLLAAYGAAVYAATLYGCGVRLIIGSRRLEWVDRW